MAFVGHYVSLEEAVKLTQSPLMSGLIETLYEGGQLLARLPVDQVRGPGTKYNRKIVRSAREGAQFVAPRQRLDWQSDDFSEPVEVAITEILRQDALDHSIASNWSNINDYKTMALQDIGEQISRFVEYNLIYGNITRDKKEFDGLHALASQARDADLNVDAKSAGLSIYSLRKMIDACKARPDQKTSSSMFWLFPKEIRRRLGAAYYEKGIDTGWC